MLRLLGYRRFQINMGKFGKITAKIRATMLDSFTDLLHSYRVLNTGCNIKSVQRL